MIWTAYLESIASVHFAVLKELPKKEENKREENQILKVLSISKNQMWTFLFQPKKMILIHVVLKFISMKDVISGNNI
jgi:hypothetical protein